MKQGLTGWSWQTIRWMNNKGGGQTGRVKDMVCLLDDIYMNGPFILTGKGISAEMQKCFFIYHTSLFISILKIQFFSLM